MNFHHNACICGSAKSSVIFKSYDYNFNTTNYLSDIRKCANCSSIFPDVFPDSRSLGIAYSSYYTRELTSGPMPLKRRFLRYLQGDYSFRSLPLGARSLLDYGCGSGEFLLEIQALRSELRVAGSDISTPPAGYQNYFKFYEYGAIDKAGENFDNITLSHVIEHVVDPLKTFSSLTEILESNGSIWISTPNADSSLINEFREYARDVDFPRHRIIFTYKAIEVFLDRCGYNCNFLMPPLVNTFTCFFQCLRNLINDKSLSLGARYWRSTCAAVNLIKTHLIFNKRNIRARSEIVCVATKKLAIERT